MWDQDFSKWACLEDNWITGLKFAGEKQIGTTRKLTVIHDNKIIITTIT